MCMYVFMYIWIQFFSLLTQDSHVFLNTVCLKKYVYVCMYVCRLHGWYGAGITRHATHLSGSIYLQAITNI